MDIRETALRAIEFIAEGRQMAADAIAKIETADIQTSNALLHELDHALGTIATGHETLHALMVLMSSQHQASALPSEQAKNE